MGHLQYGQWKNEVYDKKIIGGRYVREQAAFRNWITPDGSAGLSGVGGFKAEPNRYHLYVSYACPWAHRTLLFRKLKGLEKIIPISVVHWLMAENGWTFSDADGVIPDVVNHVRYLYEIYVLAKSDYTGRVTVPILWDKQRKTIVSNESSEIIRMFNSVFDGIGAKAGDYYPESLRKEIDDLDGRIYEPLYNGVYKAGFSTNQEAYEGAVYPLFETLEWLEKRLDKQRYLTGKRIVEADLCLFTTLVRFDAVYVRHFKCNLKRIVDYPNISHYLCDLYQHAGMADTVNMEHIKKHYFCSHVTLNPTGVVPMGPIVDLNAPHDRNRFDA